MLMPLGRDYRLSVGSVELTGYPCLRQASQRRTEALNRSCPKAKVGMRLDRAGRCLGVRRLRVCACVSRACVARGKAAYPPPRRGLSRAGEPLKFSPLFHGTDF
jgi:hypothetical protein